MNPVVSVVIPVYNHAHRIQTALNSVRMQTFKDYEIIVIDDGSTDNLENVLKNYSEAIVIVHPSNQGGAAARNTGILASRGKYIAFLDADDEWMPEKLEKQLEFLKRNPDIDICLTGFEFVPVKGEKRYIRLPKVLSWEKYLLKHIGFPDGTIPLISRECFDEIGLQDKDFVRHQNWEWLLRASSQYQIGVIDDILVVKRKGKNRPPAFLKESSVLQFVEKYKNVFFQYGNYGKSAVSLKWFDLAIAFFYEKEYQSGWKYLLKGIGTWPFQTIGLYFRLIDSLFGTNIEYLLYSFRVLISKFGHVFFLRRRSH